MAEWQAERKYVLGLDLGQAADYTALCIVQPDQEQLHVRHIERFPLKTPYPTVVHAIGAYLSDPRLKGAELVVDHTGVGVAVVDMFRQAKLSPIPVTITGGDQESHEKGLYRVPKRDLVGQVQVLLQNEQLKIADRLPYADTLVQELLNFRLKIDLRTAHDSYEAWREGAHDDLVLALALACWWAARPPAFAMRQAHIRGRNVDPLIRRAMRRLG